MMKKIMIATAITLAGGIAMAGAGYTDLANSTSGNKTAVPVAKASAKSIAGEKAYTVTRAQFMAMMGLTKRSSNKSLAGDKARLVSEDEIRRALESLNKTFISLYVLLDTDKATPEIRQRCSEIYSLMMKYELILWKVDLKVQIPSKADALAELKTRTERKDAIGKRLMELLNNGTYYSQEIDSLNKELKELENRIWFLETITMG